MKKLINIYKNISSNRRCSSADRFCTSSSIGAVTPLILMFILSFFLQICISGNNASAIGTVSLTISSNAVDLSLAPTQVNGSFAKSGNITISASTDNSTGYTLGITASSSTNYDKLINSNSEACNNTGSNANSISGYVSSNCFNSISSATSENTFSSSNSTSYNGLWGYLPSKYNSANNSNFLPAPSASGDTLDRTNVANNVANTYSIAIGARADANIQMDSYSNTYNITIVANEVPYTITYVGSLAADMPADVSASTSASSVNISSTTPTRDGYDFIGWCTVMPTGTNGNLDQCSGTTYSAGDAWTLASSSNTLHLYAMWEVGVTYYSLRITMNSRVDSITFYSETYGTQTVTADSSINLVGGETYKVTFSYNISTSERGDFWGANVSRVKNPESDCYHHIVNIVISGNSTLNVIPSPSPCM